MKYPYLAVSILLILFACNEDLCIERNIASNYFTYEGRIGAINNSTLLSDDSNLIICGNSDSMLILFKISMDGSLIWRKEFEAGNNGRAVGIAESHTRDLFICGEYTGNNQSVKNKILLVKTNPVGDTLWTKTYGKEVATRGDRVIYTNDQNILIAGISEEPDSNNNYYIVLMKVNLDGICIWKKFYPSLAYQDVNSLFETQDGKYIITGTRTMHNQPSTLLLLKLDENGDVIWDKEAGTQYKQGYSTIELSSGDLITCGESYGPNIGDGIRILLLKTDSGGNTQWENEYNDPEFSQVIQVLSLNNDGSYTLGGYAWKPSEQEKPLIINSDSNGRIQRCEIFKDSKGASRCHNIISIDDNTIIITGWYGSDIFMGNIEVN